MSADLLTGYHEAVFGHTTKYVQGLAEADLDRVVDEHWDPPVTLGVRLVSVVSDDLQHGGQAAYVRGLLPPAEGAQGGRQAGPNRESSAASMVAASGPILGSTGSGGVASTASHSAWAAGSRNRVSCP